MSLRGAGRQLGYREGTTTAGSPEYAGFWKRFMASFIDGIIMLIPLVPFYVLFFVDPRIEYFLLFYPVALILPWLYFAIMRAHHVRQRLGRWR